MIFPFRKKEIKFFSDFQDISDAYPISPAREFKRKWAKDCSKAFVEMKKKVDGRRTIITTGKCPGIRTLVEKGFIFQSWFDFTIETREGDPSWYKVYYPDNLEERLRKKGYTNPLVGDFKMKHAPLRIPTENSLDIILKIWSPYSVEIPKGWSLLILPVPYADEAAFSACPGVLEGFEAEIVIHLYWKALGGRTTVKAGTPLCQLVPVKDEMLPIVTSPLDEKTRREVEKRKHNKYSSFLL